MQTPDPTASAHRWFSMKFRVLLAALALVCALPGSARAGDFEDANQLFEAGKFQDARIRYEQIIKRGDWSANVFGNLGDTEFRLGEPGRAALQFERALALEPLHREALHNLEVVRKQTGAQVGERRWFQWIFEKISTGTVLLLSTALCWLTIVLLVRLLMRRGSASLALWSALVGAPLLALVGVLALIAQSKDATLAIIIAKQPVEARLAPADRAALATTLNAGSRVHILSERGDWTYCELPAKGSAWIPSRSLEKVPLTRS